MHYNFDKFASVVCGNVVNCPFIKCSNQMVKQWVLHENTHRKGKYQCTGGLQFDWIRFDRTMNVI